MLNCLNCKAEVAADEGRLFVGVFVCDPCYTMALRLLDRSEKELRQLLTMLRESIRLALIEGRLQFASGPEQELSKRDVLQAIVTLQEKRDADRSRPHDRNAAK